MPSLSFEPTTELLEARARLGVAVDDALAALVDGHLPSGVERANVDFKEEAGRRGAGGVIEPGRPQNDSAAEHLASDVACMANTPGGGALILGVDDRSGAVIGTALDAEWLRHRLFERVEIAPEIDERAVDGTRVLVLFVAEAREPTENLKGRITWRVGAHCVPIDRSQWWAHRQERDGADPMSAATSRVATDCAPGALGQARRYVAAAPERAGKNLADAGDAELLSRLGVLRPDGRLTQAGALVFCPCDNTLLELTVVDVEGGNVLAHPARMAGLALLEQLALVENRLDTLDTSITYRAGFAERPIRRLPFPAVREAVLNAVVHQDWMRREPVQVRWFEEDSALEVISAGSFVGGISADNVLTHRYARYPALADLFRAMGLVEKQGMGVDRMVQQMVGLGHRPPLLEEQPGARVRVRLDGGPPVHPVLRLTESIKPEVRRADVRIALIVHTLLTRPFVTPDALRPVLQRPAAECLTAIEAAAECRVAGHPLVELYKDVWTLSRAAIGILRDGGPGRPGQALLPYHRPEDPNAVVAYWLAAHDRITSGDHARLTGLTAPGALGQLDRLESEGALRRGPGSGRSAHFVAAGSARAT